MVVEKGPDEASGRSEDKGGTGVPEESCVVGLTRKILHSVSYSETVLEDHRKVSSSVPRSHRTFRDVLDWRVLERRRTGVHETGSIGL